MSSAAQPIGQGILDTDLALSQIGDVDAMNDMLVLLQESLARDVPQVSVLLQSGDLVGANRLLHALKGFIPIFCPESFCAEVARVEALSKCGPSSELAPAYAQLRHRLELLSAEVSAYLAANGIAG